MHKWCSHFRPPIAKLPPLVVSITAYNAVGQLFQDSDRLKLLRQSVLKNASVMKLLLQELESHSIFNAVVRHILWRHILWISIC